MDAMILYKYLAPAKARECLIDHDCIWLTPPIFLNDVLEFRIRREAADEGELKAMFDQFQRKAPSAVSFAEFREVFLSSEFWNSEPEDMRALLSEVMGVTSFTSDPLNELMWAHYAQNRGVAIGYGASDSRVVDGITGRDLPFGFALEVEYCNSSEPMAKDFSDAARALTRKREAWRYEQEWRVVGNLQDAHPVLFGDKMFYGLPASRDRVVHVVFGMFAEKGFENSIIGWLSGSDARIQKVGIDPASQSFVLIDYPQH